MLFENVRIVLISPSHPGNIGAVARAMKTMCLRDLYLVEPKRFPHADATARAAGADDVLAQATVCDSLDQAVNDCHLVIGASARPHSISCPVETPEESAVRVDLENKAHNIAIIFGREHSGLTNEEVDRCHNLIHIPSNDEFSSLNLASQVQLVTYELLKQTLKRDSDESQSSDKNQDDLVQCAAESDMALFYTHLEQTLVEIGFIDPAAPRHIMRRLRRLFKRARPEVVEVNILRGILTAMQEKGQEK